MELNNLSIQEKKKIVEDFFDLMETIPKYNASLLVGNNITNKNDIKQFMDENELALRSVMEASNEYLSGKISLQDFKDILIERVNIETDSLVIANIDEQGNSEIIDSAHFRDINKFAINSLNELGTLQFARYIYNEVFSVTRTEAFKKYTGARFLMLSDGMQPPKLTVLDEAIKKLEEQQTNSPQNTKPKKNKK